MEALFAFLCVVCVIYFIVITVYSGLSASYLVWIFFAVIFGFMAWFCGHRQNIKGGLPARLPVFVFTTFAAAVAVFVCLMTPVLRTASAKPKISLLKSTGS